MEIKPGTIINDGWSVNSLPDDTVIRTADGGIYQSFTLHERRLWAKTFSTDVYGGRDSWLPVTLLMLGPDPIPEDEA